MLCLAVCQDELVIRMLDEVLRPGFDVEFIVENRAVARRLHDAHIQAATGDPRRASQGECPPREKSLPLAPGRAWRYPDLSCRSATRSSR